MTLAKRVQSQGFTFDDLLLLPGYSAVLPSEIDLSTRFSRRVELKIPISSAAMDTVTEKDLAIALAREGGIGVIHRNLPVADQARQVDQVKRSANGVILDPVTLPPDASVAQARQMMEQNSISGIPILEGQRVVGILTRRDLRFQETGESHVADVMTRSVVTAPPETTLEEAKHILHQRKVEKLLLVDGDAALAGLITMKDIKHLDEYPLACRDARGRLRVGAAVGVHDEERAAALVEAGVDVLVVDTAHGHSKNVIASVRELKGHFDIDVVAGNIATTDAARDLVEAGADGLKVGIGPGSICTTRVVAGVGVPQLTAIDQCAAITSETDVPLIADGGVRHSGDMVKACAVGASCMMLGGLFAGLEESPGETVLYRGRTYKSVRGMGSIGAMMDGSDRYGQGKVGNREKLVPEGVEGLVPARGRLSTFVYQLCGGMRSGLGYVGALNMAQLRDRAQFVQVTASGLRENHAHDIHITKEAPNYFFGERE
jgi:IMP dehydrogenase